MASPTGLPKPPTCHRCSKPVLHDDLQFEPVWSGKGLDRKATFRPACLRCLDGTRAPCNRVIEEINALDAPSLDPTPPTANPDGSTTIPITFGWAHDFGIGF